MSDRHLPTGMSATGRTTSWWVLKLENMFLRVSTKQCFIKLPAVWALWSSFLYD